MSKWNRTRSGAIHCALFLSREIGAAGAFHHARDNRRAPRGRQEISLSLKTNTERRSDHRLARHGQMMQAVMKAQRKTDDQHGSSHFDLDEILRLQQQRKLRRGIRRRRTNQERAGGRRIIVNSASIGGAKDNFLARVGMINTRGK